MSVVFALLVSAAVVAQSPAAGARLPAWEESYYAEGAFSHRALRAFGYCAVEGRREQVVALLRTIPGTRAEAEAMGAIDLEGYPCLTGGPWRLTIRSAPIARGTLAEALYMRQVRGPRRSDPLPEPPPNSPFQLWSQPDDQDGNRAIARRVAACTMRRAPRQVHTLITRNSASIGETRALNRLRPVMLSCLGESERLNVSRLAIRGLLAEALYQASETYRELFRNA